MELNQQSSLKSKGNTKRKASVQLEPQDSPYFMAPTHSAETHVESTFKPVSSPAHLFSQTISDAVHSTVNATAPELEFAQLLAELNAELKAEFSEAWSQEDLKSMLRNSTIKQQIARLPKINNVNFKEKEESPAVKESNLISYLIQSRGTVNPEKCWRCAEGMGPFTGKECISIQTDEPFLKGTCGSCAWNHENSHCTWKSDHDPARERKTHQDKAAAAKKKVDAARQAHGLPPADKHVPQQFRAGDILLQWPGDTSLKDAMTRTIRAAQEQGRLEKDFMCGTAEVEANTFDRAADENK